MHLGEIIKNYRKEHKLSMDDFANLCGLSKSYIAMLEKNLNPSTGKEIAPTIDAIKKISIAVNMDFDQLFKTLDNQEVTWSEKEAEESKFTSAEEAIRFILEQPMVAQFGGYDLEKMSDEEIIEFANDITGMIELLGKKYNK